ncbi:hypothetical protein Desde_1137 [Desulfitobacterium dehalogenans ATCC 51507]|uniref:Uncharacterized protein n=1 Tax=Desulfitobacterium dehalogenans (strain ATCC 51507 / DSM 9161 / JW/IU-DC1) TaxID=756499 RepID=I4A6I4_DESDJ|nr:hypothetical protein [Desulfitobacterium dehalogenans]AFL99568.1 hypothetical protein Desde_1137 [Desulfitobacterium dehalogenans ATCC 51507]
MKRSGEIQKHTEGRNSAKYESLSASDKQKEKKKKDSTVLEQS